MRLVINLLLLALAGLFVYMLTTSIQEPIAFEAEKSKRKDAVIDRLKQIREAQKVYRDVTGGEFAANFDTLNQVLRTGKIPQISVFGDLDDPNFQGEIRFDTSYTPAIKVIDSLNINLDSIRYIPFANGKTFAMQADTITYQSTLVNVTEVRTSFKEFMGKFAADKYKRYDKNYDPTKVLKFGSMSSPSLSGNW